MLPIMISSEEPCTPSPVPRFYSQLKKAHKERVLPELKEDDLEESFVRGAGSFKPVTYTLLMHAPHWIQEAALAASR